MVIINLESILKIVNYGKYSKPFINYLTKYAQNRYLKRYLKILKIKRVVKNHELIEKVDEELKKCKNTGIKYLLLDIKLNIAWVSKDTELDRKLYLKLKKEFGKIPVSCRNMIGKSLKMDNAYNCERASKDFRTWSKEHVKDDLDVALELNVTAIKYSRKKEYEKASKIYYCVYKNALKHPHPTYITVGLNNSAWYRKYTDTEKASEISNELAYYLGYYLEYVHSVIGYLDTILNIARMRNDYVSYYDAAEIFVFYYGTFARSIPELGEKYRQTMNDVKKYCLIEKIKVVKKDEVPNSSRLQKFLKCRIEKPRSFAAEKGLSHASLYRIMNGEKKTVKIKTLVRISRALELGVSFENPNALNYAILLMREDELFEENLEKLYQCSAFDLKFLVLRGVFVQLPNESVDYIKLFSFAGDTEKFISYVSKDYSMKKFVNSCFKSEYPYYTGRYMLFKILTENIGDKNALSKLVELYTSVGKNEDFEMLNVYFREYARYSTTDWDFDAEKVLEKRFTDPNYGKIAAFCERLNMSELYGYICTWFFEGKDRRALLNILSVGS